MLTVITQNLAGGGLASGDGDPQDRWPALAERIGTHRPDLLLLQEATDWDRYGHRQLGRAMNDLDLDACPLPPSSTGIRPALLYRNATMGRWRRWNTDWAQGTLHGFGVGVFDVAELPRPLAVVPFHLDPHSPEKALAEAKLIATRGYKYGPFAIIGGDVNYPPIAGPEPDYTAMRPYNLAARTVAGPDGHPVPDRRVAAILARSGYVDAAWALYQRTGQEELLARTGRDDRIDQIWVSAPLAPALTGYRILDTPAGASDHHGVLVELDLSKADTTNLWKYR